MKTISIELAEKIKLTLEAYILELEASMLGS